MMQEKRKTVLIGVFAVMLIAVLSIVFYYVYEGFMYVKTEDAKLSGDIVRISPKIVGELQEFEVEEGDMVEKDQVLGMQSVDNVQDDNYDVGLIKSPISGKIIKKQGTLGEIITPGQTILMVTDVKKIYVTANIEETKVGKLKKGQIVDINLDQFDGKKYKGKVASIGQASNSTFSIFPSSSGTTFTKVIQKVPVKIEFEHGNDVLMGTNAIVKIHIR
jgi:multidrug resistance efflux pump